ncbi:MAG: PLD-like protein [Rhodocyclales bacterium]|nr:PLD-like protein [Rhodocyclales bacterium]
MGHNMLRDYWDTDDHVYDSDLRLGFLPWQDLSSRVYGPVLWDLNENFCTAWTKAQPWIGSDQPIGSARLAIKPTVFAAPAAKHGTGHVAQITRTQPQENDRSILESYKLALANARNYVYFENQYFRNTELAMQLRSMRRKLKTGGWKKDLYVFVVTNVPDGSGKLSTFDMLKTLGKAELMPTLEKKHGDESPEERALRKTDLDGMNVVVCTLCASGYRSTEAQAYQTGGTGPMGFPAYAMVPAQAYAVYKNIYVHAKLLLVDDVFFTLGSANVNVRSMEVDSELNIAMPAPEVTRQWREHLWKLHTGAAPGENMSLEFKNWGKLVAMNSSSKSKGEQLSAPLIEFFDGESAMMRLD